MRTTISARQFAKRLRALALSHAGCGLPRRAHDRNIVFKAAALGLAAQASYTEPHLNEALRGWLDAMGFRAMIDHVSLRRHLVDEGYLARDAAGRRYEVRLDGGRAASFEPAVNRAEPSHIVEDARREAERRRAKHAAETPPGER